MNSIKTSSNGFLHATYALYFICGLAQGFDSVFFPEFKTYFNLTYTQQTYMLFVKHIPFVVFSIALGVFRQKIGAKQSLIVALFLFAFGTWLLVPALQCENYALVLAAFFILGTGFNLQLVAGNPLIATFGNEAAGASRLNLATALGAIAQIAVPLLVIAILPEGATTVKQKIPLIKNIFLLTSGALLVGCAALSVIPFENNALQPNPSTIFTKTPGILSGFSRTVIAGFVALFLVLGVEAGVFGFFRNYLEDEKIGLTSHQSQQLFTVYFILFAAGRIVGFFLQKRFSPSAHIAFNLVVSITLMISISWSHGATAIVSITVLGFFISVFFPTLYSIASKNIPAEKTGRVAGFLTMAFLGAALLPMAQGKLADITSLPRSFMIAIVPYLFCIFYVLKPYPRKSTPLRNSTI